MTDLQFIALFIMLQANFWLTLWSVVNGVQHG